MQTRWFSSISFLVLGAGLGVGLAAAGLVTSGRGVAPLLADNAVARVNGEPIRIEDYQLVLTALAQDKRDPLAEADRQRVLDRLIDEELLVQRGLELDMPRRDSRVRKDLTAAVIDAVVTEVGDAQPSEDELQRFYDEHRDFFTAPGRLRVRQVFCRVASGAEASAALDRAQQAVRRLRAGEDFATVRIACGDREPLPLPETPLPPAKLVEYLGPTAARAALSLDVGAVSEPARSSGGWQVLQVVEREPDTVPPLAEIKSQVAAEFRRRAGERALRAYLDDLRARAQITRASKLP
jgi:parvulin-like peptidyl-prolyl isomerase